MLVLVVAKKMREGLRMFAGTELRAGCAMAGAKALLLLIAFAARLKPCPCYKAVQGFSGS
jgi:hypothetical protein